MRAAASRWLALTIAIAATGVGGLSSAPMAQAAACAGTTGVTVVVDYGSLGGTSTGCASGDPSTGLAALTTSGHAYVFLARQPGFVCTIDALPNPCNGAPASAYWSYWHAQPGGSWTYASTGAGSYNPQPGSVDGWSFGGGSAPGSPPPAVMSAPKPVSSPTPTTSSSGDGLTVGNGTTSGSAVTSAPGGTINGTKATGSPAASPTSQGATPSGTTATGTATDAATTTSMGAQTLASAARDVPSDGRGGLGGLGGLALGGGLVVLLGGVAGYLAWHRRQLSG